jgi:hypothetical protein
MATIEQEKALALARARLRMKETNSIIPSADLSQQDWDKMTYSPTVGMSVTERFAAGYGGAIPQMVRGIGQRLGLVDQKSVDETARLEKPLLETSSGALGRTAGLVVPLAGTSIIPAANTVAGGAAVGGMAGLAEPTQTGESVAGNVAKGAVLGGLGAAVARALPTGAKAITDPMREGGRRTIAGRVLNQVAGSNAAGVQAAARHPQQLVPGSVPTLAEATQDAGIAGFQLAASSASPEVKRQLAEQAQQNMAARLSALRGVAGTPQEQAMARGLRDYMSEPLYRDAMTTPIDPARAQMMAPQMQNLMQRMPAGIVERARELARINGEAITDEGSMRGLQYVKMAVDDMLSGTGNTSIGKQTQRALMQFKNDLNLTLEELSPAFTQANRNYATFSKPINEQQTGQYLLEKLQPALMDYAQSVPTRARAESFAGALRDAPRTIRGATGMRGFSELSDVMSPGGVSAVEGVARDLARSASAQDLAKTIGSTTAQNLSGQNLIRQFLGPLGMPQGTAERIAGSALLNPVTRATNLVYGGAEQRIQQELARALTDPKYAAQLMQGATRPTFESAVVRQLLSGAQQGAALTPVAIGMQN